MRYVKVLLLVVLFFLVMMFFVQNQDVFSQAMGLKLDLLFLPPMESAPLPFYTLLLICFLLGALCTLLMLVWDRLSISAKLTMANMRIRSLEKELQKAGKAQEDIKLRMRKPVPPKPKPKPLVPISPRPRLHNFLPARFPCPVRNRAGRLPFNERHIPPPHTDV